MKRKKHSQSGLTLVEVMIGVAVVGVLAAVVTPTYGNYTRRAKVAEGLVMAQPLMNKVREEVTIGEYVAVTTSFKKPSHGVATTAPDAVVPVVVPQLSSLVTSVVRYGLVVVVNFSQAFDPSAPAGYSLAMKGTMVNGALTWDCKVGAAAQPLLSTVSNSGAVVGVPLPLKWAPAGCVDT